MAFLKLHTLEASRECRTQLRRGPSWLAILLTLAFTFYQALHPILAYFRQGVPKYEDGDLWREILG